MLRKFVLPLVAVTLLGAPAFAATEAAPAPAKTMSATAPVAKPVAKVRATHVRKRHVLRRVRHHRHVAVMKARPAKRT